MNDEDPSSCKQRNPSQSKSPSGNVPRRVFAFEVREMQQSARRFVTYDELQNWVLKKVVGSK